MTIYISQFWCGVLVTLLVELVLFIGLIIFALNYKGGQENGKSKDRDDKSNQ